MSNKLMEMRTVQQYKEYAESTEQLNEALNNEIKQCYWQIDSLKADLKRATEGSPNRDQESRLIGELQLRVNDLQLRCQGQQNELQGQCSHIAKIEFELREQQQQNQFKSRLLKNAESELQNARDAQREADRKNWQVEQRCKQLQEEFTKQTSQLREESESRPTPKMSESRRQEQQQLDELRQKNIFNEQKIRTMESELNRSQEDNGWLKQLVADKSALEEMLMKQVGAVTNERVAAEKIAKEAETLLASARNEAGDMRHKLTVLSGQVKELESKLQIEEQHSRRYQQECSEAKSRLAQKDQINARLEATVKQLEAKLADLDEEINGYRRLTDQSRRSLAQSRHNSQETVQLRAEVNRLTNELAAKHQAVQQFNSQIEELSSHITKLEATRTLPPVEEELELAANEIISLRSQLHSLNDQRQLVIKLKEENAQLRAAAAGLEEEAKKALRQSNVHGQKLESSRFKAEFAEVLRKNNALIEANARLEITRNELQQQIEELKRERKKLPSEVEVSDLKRKLVDAYDQMEQLSRALDKENSQNNSLKMSTLDSTGWRQKQPKANPHDHWLEMQRRIADLRSENDTLRRNLSFTGQWRA